jgi:hypothetical protein
MLDARAVMACGHISNFRYTDKDGSKIPVCSECLRTKPELAKTVVKLAGRVARCRVCKNPAPSSPDLFDFQFNTRGSIDSYYDGCQGW